MAKLEDTSSGAPLPLRSSDLFGRTGSEAMHRAVCLSSCRRYRYTLRRRWGPGAAAVFIGLNPSTADETQDDPTIRRCIGFACAWGFDALCMVNLFAYRATDPADMKKAADPVGDINDATLLDVAKEAGVGRVWHLP